MRKVILTLNVVSLIMLFAILANVNIPLEPGVTGFATAISSATFSFQPSLILAFLVILGTMVLNTYFFLKSRSKIKIKK